MYDGHRTDIGVSTLRTASVRAGFEVDIDCSRVVALPGHSASFPREIRHISGSVGDFVFDTALEFGIVSNGSHDFFDV